MKKLQIAIFTISLAAAMSVSASMTVSLVPDTLNVAPGSTVNVSVDLSGSQGFTMAAMSAVIFYDPTVFTYVDPSVVQGTFLKDNWDTMGAAVNAGTLIVGAFDWSGAENLAAGDGTLFTFTLLVNANAPLGPSALNWGDASGGGGGGVGFDYGDADWNDVVLPSDGASITVSGAVPVPEPTTMIAGALLLLPFGASTLRILRKRTA
jgi:hypothetical protein